MYLSVLYRLVTSGVPLHTMLARPPKKWKTIGGDVALDAVYLPDQGNRLQVHKDYPSLLARTCNHKPGAA